LVSALVSDAGCARADTVQSISPVKNNETTFIMMCVLSVEGTCGGDFFFVSDVNEALWTARACHRRWDDIGAR
jgi:hypothetical protein